MTRLLVALAAAALAVGCGGSDEGALDREHRLTWRDMAVSLKPGVDGSSTNPCQRGDLSCFDLLLAEMRGRVQALASQCDHDVAFALMYLRTTEASRRAAEAGRYEDPAAMTHFGAWFGRYYLNAYDAWHEGRADAVPEAWRRAFDAADRRAVRSIGNLLLGMNAHISRDLAFTVSDVVREPTSEIDPDFLLFTTLIEEISERTIDELADRFDPDLRGAQIPLVLGGLPSLRAVIGAWRVEAWQNGVALARASAGQRAAVARRIETEAGLRAGAMLPSVSFVPLVDGPERRDAHCASRRVS